MSEPVVSVVCQEPEGVFRREVRFAPLTIERLQKYRERLSKFPTLFNCFVRDADDFVLSFISEDDGKLKANGLIWEVDDVGIFFLTDIYPAFQATGHFTFWDQRFRGREPLLREMIRYVFREFGFHRIVAEVPLYSAPTLAAVERVGFVKEGRLRKAAWYHGQWWDVNLYSILREEIEDGNAET